MCDLTQKFKLCTCKTSTKATYTWKFFKSNHPIKKIVEGIPSSSFFYYKIKERTYEEKIADVLNNTEQLFDIDMNIEVDDVLLFYKDNKPFLCFRFGDFFEWKPLKSSKLKHHELITYGYIKSSKSN